MEYLQVEGYIVRREVRNMSMNPIWSDRREEQLRRERDLRQAAERARQVGPPRRRLRRFWDAISKG